MSRSSDRSRSSVNRPAPPALPVGADIRPRYLTAILTVVLTVGLVAPSFGHETPSAAEIRREMEQAQSSLAGQAARQQRAQDELAEVEQQLPDAQSQFEAADRRLSDAEHRLAELEEELDGARELETAAQARLLRTERQFAAAVERLLVTEAELTAQHATLKRQAAAFYKYGTTAGNQAVIESLSSSTSVSDLSHQVHVAGEVADHQARIVKRIAELEAIAAAERDRLTMVREDRDEAALAAAEARADVEALAAEQRQQVAALDQVRDDREGALVALQADAAAAESVVQELEEESNAIQAMLSDLAAAEEAALQREEAERQRREEQERRRREAEAAARDAEEGAGGSAEPTAPVEDTVEDNAGFGPLTWPASGPVTSPYGYRRHPIAGVDRLHAGIDIGAPSGAPIVAAEAGEVVYAGWYGGYGLAVVINHGDGYATLYAHQSRVAVSTGQTVSQGSVIGAVGSTGYSTGPHLHFEVRINGNPVDPMPYF